MNISDFIMGVRETFERNVREKSEGRVCLLAHQSFYGEEEAIKAILLNFDMAVSEASELAFGDIPIGRCL